MKNRRNILIAMLFIGSASVLYAGNGQSGGSSGGSPAQPAVNDRDRPESSASDEPLPSPTTSQTGGSTGGTLPSPATTPVCPENVGMNQSTTTFTGQ